VTTWVLGLDDPAAADRSVAGGKGASLAVLRAHGLPVPDGFVVVAGASVGHRVGTPLPTGVASAVAAAYARWGDGQPLVAVRSSAVVEDTAMASAAGLLVTELGVRGADAVVAAVARCWDSGTADLLRGYLRSRGTDPDDGACVAVVVQRLVPARVAGVAFTAHPVTGDRAVVVIEATPGLGAPAAEARVVPEHLELARSDARLLHRRPGVRGVVLAASDDRVEERQVPKSERSLPVLSAAQAAAIVRTALRVESVLGWPADVEWALDGDQVVVLQGRPVTTLSR
jgi:rifampicin phosphotransferase